MYVMGVHNQFVEEGGGSKKEEKGKGEKKRKGNEKRDKRKEKDKEKKERKRLEDSGFFLSSLAF